MKATYDSLRIGQRCNRCAQSNGEQEVSRVLRKLGVEFEIEKRFENCRDKKTLPFDFYFEVGGNRVLLEFDGQYHFQVARFFSFDKAVKKLKDTQRRDKIKDEFSEANGYHLIRIPFWKFDQIEEIITEELEQFQKGALSPQLTSQVYQQLSFL